MIRADFLLGQTVCKSYQQKTVTNKEFKNGKAFTICNIFLWACPYPHFAMDTWLQKQGDGGVLSGARGIFTSGILYKI